MATIRKKRQKWEVQIRRTGLRPISKSFHAFKDAEAWARHMEVQADRKDLPPDRKALDRVTLGELVERYRTTVSIKKRSYDKERYFLKVFGDHPLCRKFLSEITAADFAAYRDERIREVKPTSLKRELAPIHNLFEVARCEWGLPIRTNPVDKLKVHCIDQRRERRLRTGELDKLLTVARLRRNPLIARIIPFAVETGMRRGEILAMKWGDVQDGGRALLIPETKNGHSRTIPLTKAAFALLQRNSGDDKDRIFPITANAFRLAWERVKRRAGIDDLHFHDLRHEAISRFFETGLTTPEVALISGHRDMRMLFRYAHASRERVLKKLEG
jgi:integrase